jgi:hypothetical protein
MIVLALTRLHRVRIRHRDRSPRQHKAIRGKHDLHEIESTEFGALQVCYYNCGETEGAMRVHIYDACPHRMLHWRLNRTGTFGPSGVAR